MKEKVQAAIDKIRPMLKADGGDVTALFSTEKVACTADFQITHRDAETAAEG